MNKLNTCSAIVFLSILTSVGATEAYLLLDGNTKIETFFEITDKNHLVLTIKNNSDKDEIVTTDIDYSMLTGLHGFPHGAAIQFRSKDKSIIKLKDQDESGWLYPNIYNSKIDIRIVDGKFQKKKDNGFERLLLKSHSLASFSINHSTAIRLVFSELSLNDKPPTEFRIKWEIGVEEAGVVRRKLMISDWFRYGSFAIIDDEASE